MKRKLSVIILSFILTYNKLSWASDIGRTSPHPSLSPKQVVKIVMDALKNNDVPTKNHGVKVTFNFASPANKKYTGPYERFNNMIWGKTYRPMINHRRATYEKYKVIGPAAQIDVILISNEGETFGYRFQLSKQFGNSFNGSWMTDSVMPIGVVTL
ncbi:MAG: DUF4864 domain-containing protein [Pseudomonadota bacterium]|nr:DUF4864 domain-containing protein [Pseudomonadota bacterium]